MNTREVQTALLSLGFDPGPADGWIHHIQEQCP